MGEGRRVLAVGWPGSRLVEEAGSVGADGVDQATLPFEA